MDAINSEQHAVEIRARIRRAAGRSIAPPIEKPPDHFGRQADGSFLPTPVEIGEGCRAIQATWTSAERRLRAAGIRIGMAGEPFARQRLPSLVVPFISAGFVGEALGERESDL